MLRKILSTFQWLPALLLAVGLFWLSPKLLHLLDPTAATFDAGYLQRPIVAAVYYLFGIALAWVALAINFATVDRWLDTAGFRKAWEMLPDQQRLLALAFILSFLFAGYLVCLWLVPV